MSASRHVTIWCDTDDCQQWTDHGQSRVADTRRLARAEGWTVKDGMDRCPVCSGRITREDADTYARMMGGA